MDTFTAPLYTEIRVEPYRGLWNRWVVTAWNPHLTKKGYVQLARTQYTRTRLQAQDLVEDWSLLRSDRYAPLPLRNKKEV